MQSNILKQQIAITLCKTILEVLPPLFTPIKTYVYDHLKYIQSNKWRNLFSFFITLFLLFIFIFGLQFLLSQYVEHISKPNSISTTNPTQLPVTDTETPIDNTCSCSCCDIPVSTEFQFNIENETVDFYEDRSDSFNNCVRNNLVRQNYLTEEDLKSRFVKTLTILAIARYQLDHNLTVDGMCGDDTSSNLFNSQEFAVYFPKSNL